MKGTRTRHKNCYIGPFRVACDAQFWTVSYKGTVLYSDLFRYRAIAKAKTLVRQIRSNPKLSALKESVRNCPDYPKQPRGTAKRRGRLIK